jgi:hypothetical protein
MIPISERLERLLFSKKMHETTISPSIRRVAGMARAASFRPICAADRGALLIGDFRFLIFTLRVGPVPGGSDRPSRFDSGGSGTQPAPEGTPERHPSFGLGREPKGERRPSRGCARPAVTFFLPCLCRPKATNPKMFPVAIPEAKRAGAHLDCRYRCQSGALLGETVKVGRLTRAAAGIPLASQ